MTKCRMVQKRVRLNGFGFRYRVDRTNYKICMPLPPKMDATVSLMEVEEKPDVT